jgi:integrative and conjugative element protein (TIGR02256 family)
MRTPVVELWIPATALEWLASGATRWAPDETGGVLMGYTTSDQTQMVVTHWIGPGPGAVHARHTFVPDPSFQEEAIRTAYEQSGRVSTYLGDWHTHPGSKSCLSWRDRRTLEKIARCTAARAPHALMLVLGGGRSDWQARAWRFEAHRRLLPGRIEELRISPFGP